MVVAGEVIFQLKEDLENKTPVKPFSDCLIELYKETYVEDWVNRHGGWVSIYQYNYVDKSAMFQQANVGYLCGAVYNGSQ